MHNETMKTLTSIHAQLLKLFDALVAQDDAPEHKKARQLHIDTVYKNVPKYYVTCKTIADWTKINKRHVLTLLEKLREQGKVTKRVMPGRKEHLWRKVA